MMMCYSRYSANFFKFSFSPLIPSIDGDEKAILGSIVGFRLDLNEQIFVFKAVGYADTKEGNSRNLSFY